MNILPSSIAAQDSFKRQIILTFVVGFLVMAVVFAAYQVRTQSAYLYRSSTDETISLAESLAASSRSWVLANDVVGLQEVVHAFQGHPELHYAMVISPSGRVLAHSDPTKVGQSVSDATSRTLIKSPPANRVMIDNETVSDVAVPIMVDHRHVGWVRVGQGREGIAGNLQNMMLVSALFVLMAVVLSLFAALYIANRLGYRIGYLMRVAEAVQAGDYAKRANIAGGDEIARLANSLNHMLDVLARDEEQRRAVSHYTRSLIEASLDPLVTISPEGKITDVNKATEDATGVSRSELIGTDFSDYFSEPDKARQGYQQVFMQGFVTDYPLVLRHRDGHISDVLYNASVYRNEAGEILGVFAAARDVTERNKAEAALRENEAMLQAAIKILPVGLWVMDAEGKIVLSNDAARRIWAGVRYVGIENLGEYKGWRLDSRKSVGAHDWAGARAVEKGETSIEEEIEIECFDGTHKIILDSAVPLRSNDGSSHGAVTINQDITERKELENRLRESAAYSRSLIEASVDPLVTISREGKITDVNKATEQAIGRTRSELVGTDFSDYFTEPGKAREGYRQVFAEGFVTDYPLALRHRDGHITDVLYNASVYRNEAGEVLGVFAAARDVTERKQAELRLYASEKAFRTLTENSPDVIVRYDREGRRIYVNPEFERVNHLSAQDVLGKTPTELSTELKPKADVFTEKLMAVMASGTADKIDLSWIKDGKLICWFVRVVPELDADGKVVSALTIWSDISERKQMEEILRRSEEVLKESQRIAHLGSWHMDVATNEVVWSEELYKIYGFDPALPPPLYTESMKLFTTESWERLSTSIARATESGVPYELELETVAKDGGRGWMWARGEPVHDASGAVVRVRGVVMNITERKLAEKALREKEERLALATVNNGVGIWDWNLQTQEMIWDDSMYELYHIRREDFTGTEEAWRAALHPDDLARGDQEVADAISGKKPFETEFRVIWPNGEIRHIKAVAKVFRDEQGTPLRMLGINMDVSERKKAEEELLERERHSQSLLRLSRNMERAQTYAEVLNAAQEEIKKIIGYQSLWVYLLSDDKQYLKAFVAGGTAADTVMSEEGTATLTIKGDRMLEEIAESKEIVLVEDARTDERVNKEIVKAMGMRTIVNIPIMLFDRHLGCVGTGTFGDEGLRVPSGSEQKYLIAMASHMAVALDRIHLLAERKKAEQELRELNSDFVTLLENTGDFIYFKDQDSRMRFCSQTLARITGHTSWRDMLGKHDLEIFPADTARIYYEEELPIFREGKVLLNKTDPYYDEQGRPGWVNTNKWPVFGEDKKTVVGIFGISRDITELKEAEDKINELNRDLERRVVERTEQLEAANKELESFSYSVSHDLRSPLRAIDGFSRILLEDYNDKLDDEGKRLLNVVRDNTSRMGQLIDDILKFSRAGRLEISFSEIDMERLAHDVFAELQPAGANDKLQLEIEALPPALGDRAMLHQVFANLLSNAIKFTSAKQVAKIKVGCEIEGKEAVYYVKDNGAGFDMQYVDRLFGVFQRLHSVNEFEGTGIGLAIVKRIVTRHGGRVWAEGKVNEGATIYFALPMVQGSAA